MDISQTSAKKAKNKRKNQHRQNFDPVSSEKLANPLRLSVSEAAKIGGVQTKTIRRAIQFNNIKYKIIGNRYFIDFSSVLIYLHSKTKLMNKFYQFGLGQYIERWKSNK